MKGNNNSKQQKKKKRKRRKVKYTLLSEGIKFLLKTELLRIEGINLSVLFLFNELGRSFHFRDLGLFVEEVLPS